MLIALLLVAYTLFTSVTSGIVLLSLLQKFTGAERSSFSFTHIAVSGLIMLSLITSVVHIFLPVSWHAHIMVWIFNVLVWISMPSLCNVYVTGIKAEFTAAPKMLWAICLLFLIGLLLNVSAKPGDGDIGDYHLQAIQWMEVYKHVPGLGNLRNQLGNYTNWYVLNAFFGLSFTGLKSAYVLNASLLLMVIPYFTMGLLRKEEDMYLRIIKGVIFFFLLLTTYRKYTGSVTTDYPITVLTLFVFTVFLERSIEDRLHLLFVVLLCCTLVTIKQSAMTLMIIPAWFFVSGCLKWKETRVFVVTMLVSGILIFVPWIYGSVMCNGYLLFPVAGIDLFDVDWKMSVERIDWIRETNLWWPRLNDARLDIVRHYTFAQWFPVWIKSMDMFSLVLLVLLTIFSMVFLTLLLFRRQMLLKWKWFDLRAWLVIISIYAALYIWYTNAPATRYAFSSMVFMVAYMVALCIFYFAKEKWLTYGWIRPGVSLAAAGMFFLSAAVFIKTYYTTPGTFARAVVYPLQYKNVNVRLVKIKGGAIHMPEKGEQCWDTCLPCSDLPEAGLEMRGNSPEDGFRIEKKEL
jgi:hypothetical protein